MTGERGGFAADAFHDVAIAADCEDAEIEQIETRLVVIRREPFSGHSHTDAVARTLAKRTRSRFYSCSEV